MIPLPALNWGKLLSVLATVALGALIGALGTEYLMDTRIVKPLREELRVANADKEELKSSLIKVSTIAQTQAVAAQTAAQRGQERARSRVDSLKRRADELQAELSSEAKPVLPSDTVEAINALIQESRQ